MKSATGATNQHNALEAHECPVSLLSGFVRERPVSGFWSGGELAQVTSQMIHL